MLKKCGIVRVWGEELFRPGDLIYDITGAEVQGSLLRIRLAQPLDGTSELLEVEAPSRSKLKRGGVRIGEAVLVRGFGREWKPPASGKQPALVLE